jgi:hypothetical protein
MVALRVHCKAILIAADLGGLIAFSSNSHTYVAYRDNRRTHDHRAFPLVCMGFTEVSAKSVEVVSDRYPLARSIP